MSRKYVIITDEDTGESHRRLARIECDQPGCLAVFIPGPHVMGSGWRVVGRREHGSTLLWHYCPTHAP